MHLRLRNWVGELTTDLATVTRERDQLLDELDRLKTRAS